MKKNIFARLFVSGVLVCGLTFSANAAFQKTLTYNGQFADVKADAWYASEVRSAYELGFMNGMTDSEFAPQGSVSVAQGITMASRINALSNGKTAPANSTTGKWYDNAVKYAIDNGIMADGDFDSYDRPIKRYEMAKLVYNSVDRKNFKAQNNVLAIPDVSNAAEYKTELLVLYNAGIVMGSDGYGSFNPESNLTRAESAAIINRVALPENRLKKELIFESSMQAYMVAENEEYVGNREGISSGWVYDNRGGSPKYSIYDVNYRALDDISTEYGTAIIREFNEINRGTVTVETSAKVSGNGASLMFCDKNGKAAYELKTLDGAWKVLAKDGTYKKVADAAAKDYTFKITVDFGAKNVTTYINDVNVGVTELLASNLLNFRFATDEASEVTVTPGAFLMTANYAVYDDFNKLGAKEAYGWTLKGAEVKDGELVLSAGGTATKTFNKVSGKVAAHTYFILPEGGDASFKVGNLNVEAKGGKLYANGVEIYKSVTTNMWYRLKAEIDTASGNAVVYLNGRKAGAVTGVTGDISTLEFSAAKGAKIDNIKVYNVVNEGEYVPKPTTKANIETGYVVGMDICSLWKNGEHRGWACITPYDEPKTVLGYYDEGNPETADWEIKYMVEHGVDFQSFCWYNESQTGPVKEPRLHDALHEGYMYAKYSDYMKYALLWEVSTGVTFDMDKFKNHIVPYWFENYFLDSRYLVIDNQIMLYVFGYEKLSDKNFFGSVSEAKAAFEYLDAKAKEYGFDGVIACGSNGDSIVLSSMGMEGKFSYGHGREGNTADGNITPMKNHALSEAVYYIPTPSTGFDEMPWAGVRYGNISKEDFDKVNAWVKNEYLPANSKEGTWNHNMVLFGSWNEYGEGHYIMPTQSYGFKYLDSIKEHFGDSGVEAQQILPTAAQTDRINHMYPQYARLLRRDGWYKGEAGKAKLFINDMEFTSENPSVNKDGMLLFPYDSGIGEDFMLNVFATWRADVGTLKLEGNGHTVEFEVDSSVYYVDGAEKALGYKLYMQNGLPVVSFKALSEGLGYKYEEKDGNAYIYTAQYESSYKKNEDEEARFGLWNFNGVDTEGWKSSNMTLSVSNGVMKATSNKADHYDPVLSFDGFEPFEAKRFIGIEFKVKYDYATKSGKSHAMTVFFKTDKTTSYSQTNSLAVSLKSLKTDAYETYYIDLTSERNLAIWNGVITSLRFDPFDGNGTMEIDYINFVENPDYVYVDPKTAPISIANPDAESGVAGQVLTAPKPAVDYFSSTATITVVNDPRDETNHVFKVEGTADKKVWAYLKQTVNIKEYHRYTYSYDICYVDNTAGTGADTTSGGTNFIYTDYNGKTDHNTSIGTVKKGEWVTVKGECVVNDIIENKAQEFGIFLNPTNELGSVFYVDNIVVTEEPLDESEIVRVEKVKIPESTTNVPALTNAGMLTGGNPFSGNAKITWVEADKAYLVYSDEGKRWTYIRFPAKFQKGATYEYSYEVKLIANNLELPGGQSNVTTNFVFMNTSDSVNNTVVHKTPLTTDSGWVKVTGTFTADKLVNDADNQFAVYVNPIGEQGVIYEIRNITCTKK